MLPNKRAELTVVQHMYMAESAPELPTNKNGLVFFLRR